MVYEHALQILTVIIYPTVNGQSQRIITTTWPYNILRYCTVVIGR